MSVVPHVRMEEHVLPVHGPVLAVTVPVVMKDEGVCIQKLTQELFTVHTYVHNCRL